MLEQKLAANKLTNSEPVVPRGTGDAWYERVAAANEWERQHEAEWVRIDQKLRSLAARRAALDAEETRLLRYAEELKLWRGWGFGGMVEYMERVMGYAPHTASERLRVARALAELPLLEDALERGELAHSAVRELSRVAVPDTEADWLEAVQGKCLREIEAMVSGHRPGDLPDDPTEPRLHRKSITLELSPESYDLWRKLHALAAEEHGQRLSDDELIPALFRRAYSSGAPVGRTSAPVSDAPSTTASANTAVIDASIGAAAVGENATTIGAGATTASAHAADATAYSNAAAVGAGTAVATSIGADVASAGANAANSGANASIDTNVANVGAGASATRVGEVTGATGISRDSGKADSPRAFGASNSPAYKIALKQCPDCKRGWQYTGGRDIEVESTVLELAACDAVHLGSLDAATPERSTMTVTQRKREQVLARDGHCCTVPGCRRNVGLDLHHVEYQSRGGGHELSNLTTLCDLHHRATHFQKLVIHGVAPDRLTFEFRKPRDRRNVTDDDPPPRTAPTSVDYPTHEADAILHQTLPGQIVPRERTGAAR
jgi:hypothetical protein